MATNLEFAVGSLNSDKCLFLRPVGGWFSKGRREATLQPVALQTFVRLKRTVNELRW